MSLIRVPWNWWSVCLSVPPAQYLIACQHSWLKLRYHMKTLARTSILLVTSSCSLEWQSGVELEVAERSSGEVCFSCVIRFICHKAENGDIRMRHPGYSDALRDRWIASSLGRLSGSTPTPRTLLTRRSTSAYVTVIPRRLLVFLVHDR